MQFDPFQKSKKIKDVMSPLTLSLESTATASDAAKIMETRNLEAVVVIENKKLVLSSKDIFSHSIYWSVVVSFYSILLVGFFHNPGIFTKEPWTWILLGYVISYNKVMKMSLLIKPQL